MASIHLFGLVEILHQLSESENQAILCPGASDS